MKHYNQPETKFLQVVNSSIICASGGSAYSPISGQIDNASQNDFAW